MRVAVEEGTVVLRLRGEKPVAVGAGGTWASAARPAASAYASAAPAVGPAPSEQPSFSPPAPNASPRALAPPASAPDPDPSTDFRAAMAALDVGDNAEAAAGFASFLVKHPRDPRAQDAAYLRVIALQRSGDGRSMKQAAQEYLRRYPGGFRHAEMETLSR
jgi:TolA-binding protein